MTMHRLEELNKELALAWLEFYLAPDTPDAWSRKVWGRRIVALLVALKYPENLRG